MPPDIHPPIADPSQLLDEIQARYDGAPPRRARLAALASGDSVLSARMDQARRDRLLAEGAAARLALARRRRQLSAAKALDDPWLYRLTGVLRDARNGLLSGALLSAGQRRAQ